MDLGVWVSKLSYLMPHQLCCCLFHFLAIVSPLLLAAVKNDKVARFSSGIAGEGQAGEIGGKGNSRTLSLVYIVVRKKRSLLNIEHVISIEEIL